MKKEDIYINLQGKSKEELTELYWLFKNNNEELYRDSLDLFLEYPKCYESFNFNDNEWCGNTNEKVKNKKEVTIQQLKEILQPMENKEFDLKGYSVEVDNEEQAKQLQELAFKQGFEWYNGKTLQRLNAKFLNFNAFNENEIKSDYKHFKDEYVTKEIHFNDIFKETLEQQLEKAKAEVKRIEEEIEESKIKVGDWLISNDNTTVCKVTQKGLDYINHWKTDFYKCTDQELINKLNNLIK